MTTFSFKTIGCRLNQAETAAMRGQVAAAGGRIVEFGEPCDVCIIHGCVVTGRAEKNTWRLVRAAKRAGRAGRVVLAGCPVELAAGRRESGGADRLLSQADKLDPARLLAGSGLTMPSAASAPTPLFDGTRALVRVQDGCEFRCAYCIVPHTRGPSRSRPLPEIIAEIRRLADAGYQEIVLTGANLGCYAWQDQRLAQLLAAVERQTGIRRVRLSSIELSTVEREVIDRMADSPVLCRFLHLPLQSGADAVLRAMGRRYDRRHYAGVVAYALKKLGAPGLGTDLLVGFPGETEADFQDTVRLVEELPFSNLHVFSYSPRPGTPAAALPGPVPAAVKQARAARLLALGHAKRAAFARQWVGRPVEVLVEQTPASSPDAGGWTGEYLPARIAPGPAGKIPRNTIVKCVPYGTEGDNLLALSSLQS